MGVESLSVAEIPGYGWESDKPHDECGVWAIYGPGQPTSEMTYKGLLKLQDRGQQGAGVAFGHVRPDGSMGVMIVKEFGKVASGLGRHIAPAERVGNTSYYIDDMPSAAMIGHTRWSTAENEDFSALHPHLGVKTEIALAHNGHIENMPVVAAGYGIKTTEQDTDSSLLTKTIDMLSAKYGKDLMRAIKEVTPQLDGAYCLVITDGQTVTVVRDPWGFRPLSLAKLPNDAGFVVASETIAFKPSGAEFIRDIAPGEITSIGPNGVRSERIDRIEPTRHCMYEWIYTARPTSQINGASTSAARRYMGEYLYDRDFLRNSKKELFVAGVPLSGLAGAAGYARRSGWKTAEPLIKNPHTDREFMSRGNVRSNTLDNKMEVDEEEVAGRRFVLVDDSLIKGHSSKKYARQLYEAGAREIHLRLTGPRYEWPCYDGMDVRERHRLIAVDRTDEEIADYLGVDSVRYNNVLDVEQAINKAIRRPGAASLSGKLCMACATGNYPHSVPSAVPVELLNGRANPALLRI